jgi:hypothetical protein
VRVINNDNAKLKLTSFPKFKEQSYAKTVGLKKMRLLPVGKRNGKESTKRSSEMKSIGLHFSRAA